MFPLFWYLQSTLSYFLHPIVPHPGMLRGQRTHHSRNFFAFVIPVMLILVISMNVFLQGKLFFSMNYVIDKEGSSNYRSLLSIDESLSTFTTTDTTLKTVADVPGANMDHNGSITNPCLIKTSLLKMALTEDTIAPFAQAGMRSFIVRGTYRVDRRTFAVIGLSPLHLHDRKNFMHSTCFWDGLKGPAIQGKLFVQWPGEHHNLMYETVIYRCELVKDTSRASGGSLFINIDGEDVLVHQESSLQNIFDISTKPKHKISVCSFPLYRDVSPQRVLEWIQYSYRNLNIEYFLLNDGGSVNEEMIKVLSAFIQSGVVEINDIRAQFKYESKHNVLTLNDCLYSMRFKTEWLLFLDFDEYLYVEPPRTLPSLLQEHKEYPYVTFGSLWWSRELCKSTFKVGEWAIEKMVFHWPSVYCVTKDRGYAREKCLNYFGHRKFVVNPRKVWSVEIHRPVDPIDGGMDLNTSIARINHFQGILRGSLELCPEIVKENPEWWVESDSLAELARRAKRLGPPSLFKRISASLSS